MTLNLLRWTFLPAVSEADVPRLVRLPRSLESSAFAVGFLLLTGSGGKTPNSTRHHTVGPLWEARASAVLTFLGWDFYLSISRVIFLTIFCRFLSKFYK